MCKDPETMHAHTTGSHFLSLRYLRLDILLHSWCQSWVLMCEDFLLYYRAWVSKPTCGAPGQCRSQINVSKPRHPSSIY